MAFLAVITIVLGVFCLQANALNNSFYEYYSYLWGNDHFSVDSQGTEVQLKLDKSSGAGFRSKLDYQFGMFHIRMKIPDKKTEGIVTSFYLTDLMDSMHPIDHIELNYEFIGTNGTMRTNIYDNDMGHRIQVFNLWFDPTQDYHTYEILWNNYQILFLVDNIPIRVFKNNIPGVTYPNQPMHVEASIWNAQFAGKVDWSKAPFYTYYTDFGFYACPGDNMAACSSDNLFWNRYKELNTAQKKQMAHYRKRYMDYDYCAQPAKRKPECAYNNV
ncbi:hypothetical protein ABFS83_01G101700 [Erythranthe nasuta]